MNTAAAQNAYDQVIQWVSFKLDGETYCIDVMKVQEIIRYQELTRVPLAPDGHYWVRATINGHKANFLIDTGATLSAAWPCATTISSSCRVR